MAPKIQKLPFPLLFEADLRSYVSLLTTWDAYPVQRPVDHSGLQTDGPQKYQNRSNRFPPLLRARFRSICLRRNHLLQLPTCFGTRSHHHKSRRSRTFEVWLYKTHHIRGVLCSWHLHIMVFLRCQVSIGKVDDSFPRKLPPQGLNLRNMDS